MSTPFRALHLTASLLFILSFAPHHSVSTTATIAAHDTMFAGQSLTINQTLVSRDGKFELGFFTPEFKLLENGQLVLLMSSYENNYSSKIAVWSTNSTTSNSLIKAVLGDDGNLVISSSSNGNIIWQSFDHPTNAFLPDTTGQINAFVWSTEAQDWTVSWFLSMPMFVRFEQRYPKDWSLLDYSDGCVRRTTLQCGNEDSFSKMPNIRLPQIRPSPKALVVDVAKKCESACLQNCSCSAYAYDTNSSSSGGGSIRCLLWYANLLNIEQLAGDEGNDLYIRLAPSQIHLSSRTKPSTRWAIVVAVLLGTTILLGITILFLLKWWSRRLTRSLYQEAPYTFLTVFRYKDLKIATKNFSNKLGSGSFASVFKGTLPDSTPVAVKRLEGRKTMLVYDLMPNESLEKHLFHQNNSRILNWQQRYQIAIGTARGLAYLHEECRDHFGLAKLLGREFSRVVTSMRGTVGYLAPEWTSGVAITAKADAYSYRMMLFEIISGRRNLKQSKDGKTWFFPTWASTKVISEGQPVLTILDNNLDGNADVEELDRAFRVACWCIQEEEIQRPSMGQVVQILEGLLEVNPPPILSYLRAMVETEEPANFFSQIDTSEIIQGYENNN
ncbi:hypothetical protein Sjap_003505 [Stephania japonica]|uniref:Uncharacterized protein n=1 Tax=Stephania japonica TaxID=461633 RepID=A0AAP0PV45_9MAGN